MGPSRLRMEKLCRKFGSIVSETEALFIYSAEIRNGILFLGNKF